MEVSIKIANQPCTETLIFGVSYNETEIGSLNKYYISREDGIKEATSQDTYYFLNGKEVALKIECIDAPLCGAGGSGRDIYDIFLLDNTVIGQRNGKLMFVEYLLQGDVHEFATDYIHRMRNDLKSKEPTIIRQWMSL